MDGDENERFYLGYPEDGDWGNDVRLHELSRTCWLPLGDELNSGNLVHVLTLTNPRPRGVSLRPPKCSHLRRQVEASQGIALIAKADTASRLTQGSEKVRENTGYAGAGFQLGHAEALLLRD
jgi:hypothetical protein